MRDLSTVTHHPVVTELVDVLCSKTQKTDRNFFQTEVAYFLGKIAGTMRAKLLTKDRGEIPINIYAIALANSGFGKGHSIGIMENEIFKGFKDRFLEETFPAQAEIHLMQLAVRRANIKGTDIDEEFKKLEKEFQRAGAYAFTFDSATPAAIKQFRHKLLMANVGSINLQVDEIGSNLTGSSEALTTFLELYDLGMIKQKLTKNTQENERSEEIDGKTPTNALLFGTPSRLFDGAQTEDEFYRMLDTGYARRCIFGWGQHKLTETKLTPQEIYNELTQPTTLAATKKWKNHFTMLADITKFDMGISVPDAVAIELLEYRVDCESRAEQFAEHEEIKKAEMSHRYFKALKLAGALAFVDEEVTLTMDHLYQGIKLVEDSGIAFQKIMTREKAYVKLARYIAGSDIGQTHADLNEALPYYKSGIGARNELITMATSWGIKNNIMIKKSFIDGIEFFEGETLTETDLDKVKLSYSSHLGHHYAPQITKFSNLHKLTQQPDLHWANHHFKNQHREEVDAIKGFNLVVIDVDGGVPLTVVHKLLKDYVYMTYTTKRSTPEDNRFRLILPINYHMELDSEEYKEFMDNVVEWLPFKTDEQANQRSRKWLTCDTGEYAYNMEGELLDILRFIPRTSKNEAYKHVTKDLASYDNLERWFAQRMVTGNRNNHMARFALALVDYGLNFADIKERVVSFNKKLSNGLPEDELHTTVLRSVASKLSKKVEQ